MKKNLVLAIGFAFLAMAPGMANATHFDLFSADADCEGWNAAFTIQWVNPTASADLVYSVVLFDENNMEMTRFDGAERLTANGTSHYSDHIYSEVWGLEMCGDYTVSLHFELHPDGTTWFDLHTAEYAFTCECDEPGDCFLTPGYWKNHFNAWPQTSFVVGGGDPRTSDYLLMVLNSPVKDGDATVILGHHLIAAKLNVMNGGDNSIQSVIDQADDYLSMYPIFSNPGDDEGRQHALALKDMLCAYNEQGCDEEDDEEEDDDYDDLDKSMGSAVDHTSWDNLKAFYK